MDAGAIDAIFIILSSLGGIAAIIGASGWAKAEHIRAERMGQAKMSSDTVQDSAMLVEMKALKQQVSEMQSTCHQFDISFDAALNRLEERVSRVETKVATAPVAPPQTEEMQRVGLH